MSYDVYVGDWYQTVSFNGRPTFQLILPPVKGGDAYAAKGGLWALDGLTGRKAADAIAYGMIHGDHPTGLYRGFLARLHLACLVHPRCKVRVYG